MNGGLTPRMANVLAAIRKLTKDGVSPSIREIMGEVGMSNVSEAHDTLLLLKERGAITWIPGAKRSIRIIERPRIEDLRRLSTHDLERLSADTLGILAERAA